MKPFLFLGARPEDTVAQAEYEAVARLAGLAPRQLHRVRLEAGPVPQINLSEYSGILLGGSPFNVSDDPAVKPPVQLRFERGLQPLLREVVARDFPFLGACFGIGILGTHLGGVVDTRFGERPGAVEVVLTDEGRRDPLLELLPNKFAAFVGHKEACSALPQGAVLLAKSADCPVQMFRVGRNVYATQFHPELDLAGVTERVLTYQNEGYFADGELATVLAQLATSNVTHPAEILRAFVARYGSSSASSSR